MLADDAGRSAKGRGPPLGHDRAVRPALPDAGSATAVTTVHRCGPAVGRAGFWSTERAVGAPRLFLLTRNAQPVNGGDRANAVHAVLWGWGALTSKASRNSGTASIDVDESVPAGLHYLWHALAPTPEDQVVYHAGLRRVPQRNYGVPAGRQRAVDLAEDTISGCQLVISWCHSNITHLIRQLAKMRGRAPVIAVSHPDLSRLDDLTAEHEVRHHVVVTVAAGSTDPSAIAELFARFGADLPRRCTARLSGGVRWRPGDAGRYDDDDAPCLPKLDASWCTCLRWTSGAAVRLLSPRSGLTGRAGWRTHPPPARSWTPSFYARRAAGLPVTTVNWGLWKAFPPTSPTREAQASDRLGSMPMAPTTSPSPRCGRRRCRCVRSWSRPTGCLATAYRTRIALHIVDDLLDAGPSGALDGPGQHEVPSKGVGRGEAERQQGIRPPMLQRTGFGGDGAAGPRQNAGADRDSSSPG